MFQTCSQKWDNLVFQNEMRNMFSAFRVWGKQNIKINNVRHMSKPPCPFVLLNGSPLSWTGCL